MYTDPLTNITFPTWSDGEGYTFGMIVPDTALTTDEYDYIGYLVRYSSTIQYYKTSFLLTNFAELYNSFRSRRSMVWSVPWAIRANDPGPPTHGLAL